MKRISQIPRPHDVHSLRVFLGLAGHFRAFIKDYATKSKCLTALTQKDVLFEWTKECDSAYQELTKVISSRPVLTLPDFTKPFELATDASNYGTEAILYQIDDKESPKRQLKAIGYYSYTFTKAEMNYSTTKKEALAVVMAQRYFRACLEGRRFRLFTDNQALTYILSLSHPKRRLARWVSELQQFTLDIAHRPGGKLPDADAMSRLHMTARVDEHHVNVFLWEGTEVMSLKDGWLQVPKTSVPKILALYHDSPHSG